MKVERKQWSDVTLLKFVGEFDAFNLPTFSSKIDNLVEQGFAKLVFNLKLLKFINSSALGYLVKTKKAVEEKDGDMVISSPSKFVKKALTALGLHEFFSIFESDEEAVLFYHRGEEVETIDLAGAAADPELLGENSIMFRLQDDDGNEVLGPTPFVGKISSLYKNGLQFRWEVVGASGRSKLNRDNFDEFLQTGRALKVKFRQPFMAKTKYYEAGCTVMKVSKSVNEEGVPEAAIHLEYTDINDKDRDALDQFVTDLESLRSEVK
ncbi:MAG: STAS domain-containing protein [Planctomycetota bacterium]|jgi:anti-sigma B factor antagonist